MENGSVSHKPRQSNYDDCKNDTTISSLEGLNYTQYCHFNILGGDRSSGDADSLQNCIDSCTSYGPVCFGITWDPIKRICYRKDSTITISNLNASDIFISAIVASGQYEQDKAEFVCPYPNLSVQKARSGMEFQILCGGVFLGSPGSLESIVHVKSLDDCLEKCAISHPLCTGVSYVADLRGTGWLNCRLIRFLVDPRMAPYTRTMGHSAGASIRKLPEGADCREESNRKDQHGRSYKLSCSDFRDLNNTEIPPLEMHHEDKLDDCITRCSNAMPLCNTIVFDEGLQSGFQNCYLFDDFPPPQSRKSNYTFLYLENLSSRFQSPPPIQSAHLNTGQIVGVALGSSTVVVGLSIWLVVWRRKRKNGIKVKST